MSTSRKYLFVGVILFFILGATKYWQYNYVENTIGQARTLKIKGLSNFFCRGAPLVSSNVDQCGRRSIYKDSDWGITAYFTIYGVETEAEAKSIAKFMIRAREKSPYDRIPINLVVYSSARSEGSRPRTHKILEQDL